MKKIATVVVTSALALAPVAAMAQSNGSSSTPAATNMKGSPNAAGFGKSQGQDAATGTEGRSNASDMPSATNMKGSPNANGYHK